MQAVYFPQNYYDFKVGQNIEITCNHDEYSLWFDVVNPLDRTTHDLTHIKSTEDRSLGYTLMSRNRLAQCNDNERNEMFIRLFKKV
jgi:hypothetical protein